MARPKKEENVKVDDTESVHFVKVSQTEDLKDPEVETLKARISELEADRNEWRTQHDNAVSAWKADVDVLSKKLEEARAVKTSLTEDQKKALRFCLHWVADVRRRSRSVPFRQEAQEAMALLAGLS